MKLTTDEENERQILMRDQKSTTRPMSKAEFERLRELNKKLYSSENPTEN